MATGTKSSETNPPTSLPVHCKTGPGWIWPEQDRFYLLTGSGPFICRRTPFFQSTVPARTWHRELVFHEASVRLHYPCIPQRLFESVVGFFDRVAADHRAEAVALLAYRPEAGYEVLVPDQWSLVEVFDGGESVPVRVRYEIPPPGPGQLLVGSLHSHPGRLGAFSSYTDADDARCHFPGLHFVVGDIDRDPPSLHCLFAVDGSVVNVADPYHLIEGYTHRRDTFPAEWLDRVVVEEAVLGAGVQPWLKRAAPAGADGAACPGRGTSHAP